MEDERRKLIARGALIDSFWLFFQYGFGAKFYCQGNPADAWVNRRVHKRICDWFEWHVKDWEQTRAQGIRKPKKLLFLLPRGYGKSTLVTAAGSLWVHLRNPDLTQTISSYGIEKSRDFLGVIKTSMEGRSNYGWWKDLWGSWEPFDSRQWTIESVTHSMRKAVEIRDPSIDVTSITKGGTGTRPDFFVLDDPTSEEKIAKEEDHIKKGVKHLQSMRFAVKSNGLWVVDATRYRDGDVPAEIMNQQGVKAFAEGGMEPRREDYNLGGEWEVFFLSARDARGDSTLPNVYPNDVLDAMEKEDPTGFAAQMMNMPAEGKHSLLTKEDIDKLWVLPESLEGMDLRITIHLDTAFKTLERTQEGDDNVIAVVGHSRSGDGQIYMLDAKVSNAWTSEDFFDELVALLQRLKRDRKWPYCITDERETGGKEGLFGKVLQARCSAVGMPMPRLIQISRAGTRKEVRIRMAADYWRQGKVRLLKGNPGIEKLAMQMRKFGFMEHDDVADAFADAFAEELYFSERVAANIGEGGVVTRRPMDNYLGTGEAGVQEAVRRSLLREERVSSGSEEAWYR